jgi:hypothetical protein
VRKLAGARCRYCTLFSVSGAAAQVLFLMLITEMKQCELNNVLATDTANAQMNLSLSHSTPHNFLLSLLPGHGGGEMRASDVKLFSLSPESAHASRLRVLAHPYPRHSRNARVHDSHPFTLD